MVLKSRERQAETAEFYWRTAERMSKKNNVTKRKEIHEYGLCL